MTTCRHPSSPAGYRRPLAGLLCGMALALLSGCADVHWERAFYDGFQRCPPGHSAQNETCGRGPAYDRYEEERERLQADKPKPPAGNNPIEEKQL
jgi:hypothetical protein